MWATQFSGVFAGAQSRHVEGISDLDLRLVGGIWHLYVTTRPIPMVVAYELGASANSYVLDDVQSLQGDGLRPTATVFLSLAGQDMAVSLGTNPTAYASHTLNALGDLTAPRDFSPSIGIQSSFVAARSVRIDAVDYVIGTRHGFAHLQVNRIGPEFSLTQTSQSTISGTAEAVAVVKVGGAYFVYHAATTNAGIGGFALSATGMLGGFDGSSQHFNLFGKMEC